jgi:hypothetical protein
LAKRLSRRSREHTGTHQPFPEPVHGD